MLPYGPEFIHPIGTLRRHAKYENLPQRSYTTAPALKDAVDEGIGSLVRARPTDDRRRFFQAAFKSLTLDGHGRGRSVMRRLRPRSGVAQIRGPCRRCWGTPPTS